MARVCRDGEARCFDPFCPEHSPLMNAPLQFWVCPVRAHRERGDVVTVRWDANVAHCTAPHCTRTSVNGVRQGDTVRYWPGARQGEGHVSVALSNPVQMGGSLVVRLRRNDRVRHSDAIALTHVAVEQAAEDCALSQETAPPEAVTHAH